MEQSYLGTTGAGECHNKVASGRKDLGGKTWELTEVKKPEEQMHQAVCSETKGDDATDSLRQTLASKRSQF